MAQEIHLPKDPVNRFFDLYQALKDKGSWLSQPSTFRFAAVAALTCPGKVNEVADAIWSTANDISEQVGWFSQLRSSIRFVVSAMLVLHGDRASRFLTDADAANKLFREHGLRRGGMFEILAILILRLHQHNEPITPAQVKRFKEIYEAMKSHHWWLTGPDDFPACAILTSCSQTPKRIGEQIERIYQGLTEAGFSKGDPLQTASNLLFLTGLPCSTIVNRYATLATAFKARKVSIFQSDYDELTILSFLDHQPNRVADRVLEITEELKRIQPRVGRNMRFNLGSSLTFLELVQKDRNLTLIHDAKALMDMQTIISAQQAAAVAAAAGAAAAASSAG